MNTVVVCCMCGDVGFSDKLFRCSRCINRFQHSYCSNYYISNQSSTTQINICDWCQYEETNTSSSMKHQATTHSITKRSSTERQLQVNNRSEYNSRDRVKQQHEHREDNNNKGKQQGGGVPSPRTATKRYKLLKDVMC